jgi:hypothetical protein
MATSQRRRSDRPVTARSAAGESGEVSNSTPDSREDIARRAFELYERRGGEHGHDWDDWFQAETELRR